jgi:hypothetical protein
MWTVSFAVAGLVLGGAPAQADNNVGCGVGTQLWEGKDDLVFQVLAATTNGILGNQTFGISSNTIGCKRNQVIKAEHRVNMFAGANLDRLAREMALGEGETLASLAHLMEIQEADRSAFYGLAKDHFAELFPSEEVTAGDMLGTLHLLMRQDDRLARYAQG